MSTKNQQSIHQQIQALTNQRKYKEAEALLYSIQEAGITPYQLNSARGLAAIRSGVRECKQAVASIREDLAASRS